MCFAGSGGRKASALRSTGGLQQRQGANETTYTGYETNRSYFTLDGTANTRNKYTNGRFNALFARKAGYTQSQGGKYYKDTTTAVEKTQRGALGRTAITDDSQVRIKSRALRQDVANAADTSRKKARRGRSGLRIDTAGVSGSGLGGSGVSWS